MISPFECRSPAVQVTNPSGRQQSLYPRPNGVKIHDNVEIRRGTADPRAEQKTTGPIQLQDHGHPIQYRNIWLLKGE
jgi:hypothetical protein